MKFLPWALDEKWLAVAKSYLKDVDVLSLDVFDTAVTRIVECPTDVFAMVEKAAPKQLKNYSEMRELAEVKARTLAHRDRHEDVTFEQILAQLPKEYQVFANHLELETECAVLRAVPDIQKLVMVARELGKQVIFVSDMYHSTEFVTEVLERCGYRDYDHVYVSGDVGLTKHVGTIWTVVKSRFGNNILHVGDNLHSDVQHPTLMGIKTLHYRRALSTPRTGACGPATLPYSKMARDHDMIARIDPEYDPLANDERSWFALGHCFIGPVLTGFAHWVQDQARGRGLHRLYYLAREGSLFYRAQLAYSDLEAEALYLEVSRRTVVLAAGWVESNPGLLSPALLTLLTHADSKTTARQLMARCHLENLIEIAADLRADGIDLDLPIKEQEDGVAKYKAAVLRRRIEVYGALCAPATRCMEYLRQHGMFDPDLEIGLVDSGWSGTIQRAIAVLRRFNGCIGTVHGFYYALWKTAQPNFASAGPMDGFFATGFENPSDNAGLSLGVGVVEELHGADVGSTIDYELVLNGQHWQPVYQEREAEEQKQYEEKIRPLQRGALAYVADARSKPDYLWSVEELRAAVDQVLLSPSPRELGLLGSLHHAMTFDHLGARTLACPWPGSIDQANAVLEFADWHSGLILYWYRFCAPEQRAEVRELARLRLTGYLTQRQLQAYGL